MMATADTSRDCVNDSVELRSGWEWKLAGT